MRRLTSAFVLALLSIWMAQPAAAQWPSTRANQVLESMFTQNGDFGPPPYAADPYTCTVAVERTTYYNTVSKAVLYCNATAWVTVGTGGPSGASNNLWTGRNTFGTAVDAANAIDLNETAGCITFEGSSADTAELRLCVVNPAADRTVNIVGFAANNTLAVTGADNNFSSQTFSGDILLGDGVNIATSAANTDTAWRNSTTFTPDSTAMALGSTSNSIHIEERSDATFDFNNGPCGTSACVHPTLISHSTNQSISEYSARMSAGQTFRQIKALTKSSATTFVQLPVPNLQAGATGATIDYTISGSDGTDTQVRHGTLRVQAVAKAGTVTCAISPTTETTDGSTYASTSGAGTLTYTHTCSTGANLINIQTNAVNSLGSAPTIDYAVTVTGPSEIKPQ
jgi:hypothetical protein